MFSSFPPEEEDGSKETKRRCEKWPGNITVYWEKGEPVIPKTNDHGWPVDQESATVIDPFELPCWTTPESRRRLDELLGKSMVHEMASRKAHEDYVAAKTIITRDMRTGDAPDGAMELLEKNVSETKAKRLAEHAEIRKQAGRELSALWTDARKCTPYVTAEDAASYFNCVMR
jgi:hypothetical protein